MVTWKRALLGIWLSVAVFLAGLLWEQPAEGAVPHWSPPVNISQSGTDSASPAVALVNGRLHVVWEEGGQLYHRYETDTGWSAVTTIGSGSEPDLAVGPDGTLHLVYVDVFNNNAEILYRSWQPSGWSAAVNVSGTTGASATPAIAIRNDGRRFVVWVENALTDPWVFYAESGDGLVWVNNPVPDAFGTDPQIAVDGDGRLHILWTEPYSFGDPLELFYIQWTGTEWTFSVDVSNTPTKDSFNGVLTMAPDGTLWAAWQEEVNGAFQVWTASRSLTGWGAPEILAQTGVSLVEPTLATGDRLGEAWVAGDRLQARWLTNGTWRTPETAWQDSNGISQPALAMGSKGEMWIAWVGKGSSGADDIFVSHRRATMYQLYMPLQVKGSG